MRHLLLLFSLSLACRASEPSAPPPTLAEIKALADSDNAFALDLYARARVREGNIALSPFSISTSLAMAWAGSRGDTAAQIGRVLHAEGMPERTMQVAGHLVAKLQSHKENITLRVFIRLLGEKTCQFERAYLDLTKGALGTPLERVSFRHAAEHVRQEINGRVAEETNGRISDLIPPGGVDTNTRLLSVNAVYFLGKWAHPFRSTSPARFHLTRSIEKVVPTMSQVERFGFAATDGLQLLDMPYHGRELTMTFLLPDQIDGLDLVEQKLSRETLERWIAALQPRKVAVSMPKFELNPSMSLALRDALQALGMPLAFDRNQADFTAIAKPSDPDGRVYLADGFHKAFVKVDEAGTEAAAATSVLVAGFGLHPEPPPLAFRADHPFLFLLRDGSSGAILFIGRVSDPAPAVAARASSVDGTATDGPSGELGDAVESPFWRLPAHDRAGAGGLGRKSDRDVAIDTPRVRILGAIDPELVRKVIREHLNEVRYCYQQQLMLNAKLEGSVAIRWQIGPDGRASNCVVQTDSSLENEEVQRCIVGRIVTWEFPTPKGGGIALVRYGWVLRAPGG